MTTVERRNVKRRRDTRSRSAETLLARYARKPSVALRDELIEQHRGQVESLARNLSMRLPRCVDVQDLVHAGIWGLMQAIENYEPSRGTSFLPFMRLRARGAMLDELRNMDYLPRLFRQRVRALEEARTDLRNRLRREPNDGEIAQELGVSEKRLRRNYLELPGLASSTNGALRSEARGESRNGDRPADVDVMENLPDQGLESPGEALDRQEMLAKIESSLQPIEWTVLRMHYLEGKSGKEVARALRLSASRICQIHLRVLSRLKSRWATSPS